MEVRSKKFLQFVRANFQSETDKHFFMILWYGLDFYAAKSRKICNLMFKICFHNPKYVFFWFYCIFNVKFYQKIGKICWPQNFDNFMTNLRKLFNVESMSMSYEK